MVEEEKVEMKLMSLVKTMNEKWGVLEEAWLGDFVEFLLNGQFNHRQAEETVVEIIVSWLNKERSKRPDTNHVAPLLFSTDY